MNLLYTKKEVKKVIFKTSKKLVDNHTFYLENLKKAIFRVLNSYLFGNFLNATSIKDLNDQGEGFSAILREAVQAVAASK